MIWVLTFATLFSFFCTSPAAGHPTERRLAVVVGVNAYRANSGLPPLRHAVNDASALSEALKQQGFKVYQMTHDVAREEGHEDMAPQLAYIRDQIQGVLGFPNLGEKDAVLITLHGHGVQFDHVDDNGAKTPKFYFCPADAKVLGVRTANDITERHRLLPLDELYSELQSCNAATKLLIVDACRNDPTSPSLSRSSLASSTLPKLPPPPGGTAAFFSCRANQLAIEDAKLKQGVFSHFLVKGLQGEADLSFGGRPSDGVITFAELSTYVANNTYAHVFDKFKVRQSPELRGDYDLNLPITRLVPLKPDWAGAQKKFGTPEIQFCWCPPGKFLMGDRTVLEARQHSVSESKSKFVDGQLVDVLVPKSPALRRLDESVGRQREVELTRGFWIGKYELTQKEWQSVMGYNPSRFSSSYQPENPEFEQNKVRGLDTSRFPVDSPFSDPPGRPGKTVKSYDGGRMTTSDFMIQEFCEKLTKRSHQNGSLPRNWKFTLPTDAMWEYACRAGTKTTFAFGDSITTSDANIDGRPDGDYSTKPKDFFDRTTTVGSYRPNAWGLHDMHGNISEICIGSGGGGARRLGRVDPVSLDPSTLEMSDQEVDAYVNDHFDLSHCGWLGRGGGVYSKASWCGSGTLDCPVCDLPGLRLAIVEADWLDEMKVRAKKEMRRLRD